MHRRQSCRSAAEHSLDLRSTFEQSRWGRSTVCIGWTADSLSVRIKDTWRARFCAKRVTPAHDWRDRRLAPEVWLLCERALGTSDRTEYYLVHSPATASLRTLVRLRTSAGRSSSSIMS